MELSKVQTITADLINDFHESLEKKTENFPDTEEGNKVKLDVLNNFIICVMGSYVMSFDEEHRYKYLNYLFIAINECLDKMEKILPKNAQDE